jgi:hypothetical protein
MLPPTNITELRAFLGTTDYYQHYVPHYAQIAGPLHKLLQQGVAYIWVQDQQDAFETHKNKLVDAHSEAPELYETL